MASISSTIDLDSLSEHEDFEEGIGHVECILYHKH